MIYDIVSSLDLKLSLTNDITILINGIDGGFFFGNIWVFNWEYGLEFVDFTFIVSSERDEEVV